MTQEGLQEVAGGWSLPFPISFHQFSYPECRTISVYIPERQTYSGTRTRPHGVSKTQCTPPYNYTIRQWRLLRLDRISLLIFFPGDKRPRFFNALSVDVVGVWIMFHDFSTPFLDLCLVVRRYGPIVHVIVSACMYVAKNVGVRSFFRECVT